MNVDQVVHSLQSNYTTVTVAFAPTHGAEIPESANHYTYKILRSWTQGLSTGTWVVVPVRSSGQLLLKVARITEIHDNPTFHSFEGIEYKWVVDIIAMTTWEGIMKSEEQIKRMLLEIELQKAREALREKAVKLYGEEVFEIVKKLEFKEDH